MITDGSTRYTIVGLEEGASYTITVTASNAVGSAVSNTATGRLMETGEYRSDLLSENIDSPKINPMTIFTLV